MPCAKGDEGEHQLLGRLPEVGLDAPIEMGIPNTGVRPCKVEEYIVGYGCGVYALLFL